MNNRKWKIATAVMTAVTITSLLCMANANRGMQKLDDYICVDIDTKDGGYYSLQSDCELTYYDGKLAIVHLDDPTLMAFSVPTEYNGGVCLANGADMLWIVQQLEEARNAAADDAEYQRLSEIIEMLQNLPIFTGAST